MLEEYNNILRAKMFLIKGPELHLSPTGVFCLFCFFLDAFCNSFSKVRGLRSEDGGGTVSERWTADK